MAKETTRIRDAITYYEAKKPSVYVAKKSESVDPCYGLDVTFVSDKDIEALKKGRVWYFDDGEYAHLIVREEE